MKYRKNKKFLIVTSIWVTYQKGIGQRRFSDESYTTGLALEWLAAKHPELFDNEDKKEFEKTRMGWRRETEFPYRYWYRLLPTDCSLFLLTKEIGYLDVAIANIDHHKSSLRNWVFDCLYYVAPCLKFNGDEFLEQEILKRTESNLCIGHAWAEKNLYLLYLMQGDRESKVRQFDAWLNNPNVKLEWAKELITKFRDYLPPIYNPFAQMEVEVQSYLLNKLLPQTKLAKQLKIFE